MFLSISDYMSPYFDVVQGIVRTYPTFKSIWIPYIIIYNGKNQRRATSWLLKSPKISAPLPSSEVYFLQLYIKQRKSKKNRKLAFKSHIYVYPSLLPEMFSPLLVSHHCSEGITKMADWA